MPKTVQILVQIPVQIPVQEYTAVRPTPLPHLARAPGVPVRQVPDHDESPEAHPPGPRVLERAVALKLIERGLIDKHDEAHLALRLLADVNRLLHHVIGTWRGGGRDGDTWFRVEQRADRGWSRFKNDNTL